MSLSSQSAFAICRSKLAAPVVLVCLLMSPLLQGGVNNEAISTRMSGPERFQLENLDVFSGQALKEIEAIATSGKIERRTRELLALDVPSIGARTQGPDGLSPIHRAIMAAAAGLEADGLEFLGSFRGEVAAPVSLDRLLDEDSRGQSSILQIDGLEVPVFPLWPNGPMPSLAPEGGLSGPVTYCGSASWDELKGLDIGGSIALLEFRGAQYLERLFSLGAEAVIVLEDDFVQYENAIFLCSQTPSPFPRFFLRKSDKADLLARVGEGISPVAGTLSGGQIYENRQTESLFFHLPAPRTQPLTISEALLLEWLGARHGVNTNELREYNGLGEKSLIPGMEIRIPGSAERFEVPENGLWEIVAQLNDLTVPELQAANPALAGEPLLPGATIAVPAGKMPLAILVSIDTASIVPDIGHGAIAMANVAAAIELMEFLARSPNLRLRRDVIFGFLDGDTLGGQASRLAAEYSYLLENEFSGSTSTQATSENALDQYKAAAEWFNSGKIPDDDATVRWLLDDWLRPRFEERRILIAENRIARIVNSRGSDNLPPLEVIEERLARIAELRDMTLLAGGSDARRLELLREAWNDSVGEELASFGLGRKALQQRLERELLEEERARANHSHNLQMAETLRRVIKAHGGGTPNPALAWKLDLSDATSHIGINTTGKQTLRLRSAPLTAEITRSLTPRLRKVAAYAATRAGWPEDFTFISVEDRSSLSLNESPMTTTYDDFWIHSDLLVFPLSGESDRRDRVDTPADTPAAINWNNFNIQARTAFTLIAAGTESLLDTRIQKSIRKPELSRVAGKTVQFNIRSGIDAKDPVAGSYVFYPMSKKDSGFAEKNTEVQFGYRRGIVQKTLLNGSFTGPAAVVSYNPKPRLYAYQLDRERALFTKVATQGQVGTKPQKNEFAYRASEVVEKNPVLIDVYPRVIFVGTNPSTYTEILGGAYSSQVIELVDAVINGNPRDFAIDNPIVDFREKERQAVTLYLPEGDRVRVVIKSGLEYLFMVTGPVETTADGDVEGKGILIGPDPGSGARNILLPMTPYEVAYGMWQLGKSRLDLYQQYGISSQPLREAIERSGEFLESAERAMAEKDWQQAVGDSREAWGILVKNFPRVLKLGREAVFSVILLMALAVPGAWFLERLVIGSKGIVARLGGITLIFILATTFLNLFHPAFKVALSPFIIVIAFTMILMSVIVIALSYGRFEVVLRQFRSSGGEIQSEEISFMSSLATAFSLGVSNLKKRTFRTALTVFTVVVLTFSIVAFVAVKGKDALTRISLPLDNTVEGRIVDPLPPAYDGLLIRSHNWRGASESKVSALVAEFGADYQVTRRGHYMEEEGGNSANREGVNQLTIRYGDKETIVNAVSLMEPNETDFSGLNQAVSHNSWFHDGRADPAGLPDRDKIILPDNVAGVLGITAGMLATADGERLPDEELPVVTFMNRSWKVIGILDTNEANRIRDVNGKSLAVVDFLKSGIATNTSPGELVTEGPSYHMDWKRLAIVPYEARRDIQGQVRSVAIKIPSNEDIDGVLQVMSMRLKTEFFAASNGEVFMVVPRAKVDLAGVAKVFLPVILCILIVMNTMLGTVEERKGEVGMLGAIGLSPRQIAFLMFSESTVFSVLGIILGIFGGLLFSNIINSINASGGSVLTGLSFNFTSMIAMVLATGTGLVVLAATLIPANKAAALAAPSGMAEWELPDDGPSGEINFRMPFTLTRGNAVGMAAFFNQFLINHNDATSEDFNCREVTITQGNESDRPSVEIRTDMWLAPYDLDVAQHFTMRMQAGDRENVFVVDLKLERFSGSEENSRRTSYNLLNLVRRQFLLWRNLEPARRTEFIEKGAVMLKSQTENE